MEMHFCRQCKQTLPFLNDIEFDIIAPLLPPPSNPALSAQESQLHEKIPLDIFERITGLRLDKPSDIHHHRLKHYNGQCGRCHRLLPRIATVRNLQRQGQQRKLGKLRQLTQLRAIRDKRPPQ